MPDLKPGWKLVKFGQVVRQVKDKVDPESSGLERFVAGEHMDSEDLRIRRWGDIGDGYLGPAFHIHFRPGQVLYGSRRTYLRKIALADFEGICANTTFVLESADPRLLLPDLLPFIMSTEAFHEHSRRESKGSVNPYVNFSDLAWYEFALPPLEEQRKLAIALIAATDVLERSRALLLAAIDARTATRETLINRDDFPSAKVGMVCEMQNGRPFPSADYRETGIPLLRPANLAQDGQIDWRPERTVSLPESYVEQNPDHVVSGGDLVINLTAQSLEDGFMGRVCYARGDRTSLLNQRIGRFVGFSEVIVPEYLFRVLQGARFQAHAIAMCEGTKVKHMFWRHIEGFEFSLPPKSVQHHVCQTVLEMDQVVEAATDRKGDAQALVSRLVNSSLAGAG